MASLVDAIRKILEKYSTVGQYRILFATCSWKVFDRKERKKLMTRHGKKKQYYKAMEPAEKKISLEKKQFRDMKNK